MPIGSWIGTGVASGIPTRSPSGPPPVARVRTPNAARGRQEVHEHGLERHQDRAEHHHQQQERHQQHPAEEVRQPVSGPRVWSRRSRRSCRRRATVRSVSAVAAGIASSRSRSTRSSVAASWGDVVGVHGEHRGVPALVDDGRSDVGDAVDLGELRPRAASAAPWRSPAAPCTVSTIGAENPGPNPSARRS